MWRVGAEAWDLDVLRLEVVGGGASRLLDIR